jgi:hypothetical protein
MVGRGKDLCAPFVALVVVERIDRSSGGVVVVSRLKESVDRHFLQLLADLQKTEAWPESFHLSGNRRRFQDSLLSF